MVKLKFIVFRKKLVLRISGDYKKYYRVVQVLKGNPNYFLHWDKDKERFTRYAIRYIENNRALADLKAKYQKVIDDHPDWSAQQVSNSYKQYYKEDDTKEQGGAVKFGMCEYVEPYIDIVIEREKLKPGCNFECYEKLKKKCAIVIPQFNRLRFDEINYNTCVRLARYFSKHKGYIHATKTFRAVLGRASKDEFVDFDIKNIGDFTFNDYNPQKNKVRLKPDILTEDEIEKFMSVKISELTPMTKNRRKVELYYDFCVFMFFSFLSPCDVIALTQKNLTRHGTILINRKKTHKPVEIPLTPTMEEIIGKYKGKTYKNHLFPIMKEERETMVREHHTKVFRSGLNCWLKKVSKQFAFEVDLYAYVFRHTAITFALDKGLPVSYIASAAGTSIEMIQKHYYNGDSQANRNKLMNVFESIAS